MQQHLGQRAVQQGHTFPVHDLDHRPLWNYRIDRLGIQGTHRRQ
ncbi:hypothetical protein [Streptomyces sp. NBC_00342]|nr:hypothetical protein [Streptomyces sp. NBC_00342]